MSELPKENTSKASFLINIYQKLYMLERLTHLLDTYQKILFVGVGNVIRQDDGVGIYICNRIERSNHIQTLVVGQSIENYIGKIQQINPDIIVIIDCVDFDKSSGEAVVTPLENILDYTSNTHNVSLTTFTQFLDRPIEILGIQPQKIGFGECMSTIIQHTADEILGIINRNKEMRGVHT